MANNTHKKASTPLDKMITGIVVFVVLAVLALAVYATYGKISTNIENAAIEAENMAIQNGEQQPNVRYQAQNAGKSVEDYLADYGLTLSEELTEKTTVQDMMDKMTLENYVKYSNENSNSETETSVDDLLNEWKASEVGITKDTLWSEAMNTLTLERYFGDGGYDEIIGRYKSAGYDMSSITPEMTVNEFNDKIDELMQAGPAYTPVPQTDAAE